MPRRDRDPRPPIEVIGGAPTSESLQDVSVGGGSGGQRRGGLGRWRTIAVVVVAAAALVALFASEGGGEDEASSSTTSTRRSTTTSTTGPTTSTTFAALGPLTAQPTGAVLVLADQSRLWHVLDLDTGEIRDLDLPEPMDGMFSAFVPVRGGVVTSNGAEVRFVSTVDGSTRTLARKVNVVYSAGRDDRVWVTAFDEVEQEFAHELRLLDLQGRVLARRSSEYSGFYTATELGPVISDGGRTFLLDGDGPRSLGIGNLVGTGRGHVAMRTCEDAADCSIQLVDVRTGARRELPELGSETGRDLDAFFVFTPDGDLVELRQPGRLVGVTWVTSEGRVVARGDVSFGDTVGGGYGLRGDPSFLPNREGFVVMGGDGNSYVVRVDGGRVRAERLDLPPSVRFDRMALVRP